MCDDESPRQWSSVTARSGGFLVHRLVGQPWRIRRFRMGRSRGVLGVVLMISRVATAIMTGALLLSTATQTGQAAVVDDLSPARATTAPATEDSRASITVTTYAGGSRVIEEPLYSPTLDIHTSYRVMLPPGYDQGSHDYPVLYMLHGVAGDSDEWQSIGLLEAADRMVTQGKIDPFIIVLPNGGANYWVNQATGQRWADYVVNDVVAQVDRDYRTIQTPAARAIGGLSMGGEGALRIAMQHPNVFGVAGAHSPSLRTAFDQFAPELQTIFGDAQAWRAATPLWLVLDTDSAYDLTIAIDVGEDDPWRPNVELLHQRMVSRGISHRFEILPGEHEAEYWIDNVDHYLAFYSSALAASGELIAIDSDAS
jgi:enterochelin esterase-like enzyme